MTQVNGHAWYHRGQIGMLVSRLGGKFVDTDLVFWDKPEVLGDESEFKAKKSNPQ